MNTDCVNEIYAYCDEIIEIAKTVKTVARMREKREKYAADMELAAVRIEKIRDTMDVVEIFAGK